MAYSLQKTAPSANDPTAKNRVWDFFAESNRTRPVNRRQPLEPRRKNRPCSYKTASGRPYWPSRDPIGEMGGLNLYGFTINDGVNWFDYLGLSTVTVSIERYARTKTAIYSIITISSDDDEINKCCCLPRAFSATETGRHPGNNVKPGSYNSTFPEENGTWSTGDGLTSIKGRIHRDGGGDPKLSKKWGLWPIKIPEKPSWMHQGDYDNALKREFRSEYRNDNVHAGTDERHSSGCLLPGTCPNSPYDETTRYQYSLSEDLVFKARIACARRIRPNVSLKTTANQIPEKISELKDIVPKAVPVNSNCPEK